MALARTDIGLYESKGAFGTAAYTTPSFTPPANSLLLVCVFMIGNATTGDLGTPTISGGGLAYTAKANAFGSASWSMRETLFTAPGAKAEPMTITVDDDNNQNIAGYVVSVIAFTGYDTTTPIAGAVSSGSTDIKDGEEIQTLAATPTAEDVTVSYVEIDGEPGPPKPKLAAGWTLSHEGRFYGSEGGVFAMHREASTSKEVKITDIWTSATFYKGAMFSVIVKASEKAEPVDMEGSLVGKGSGSATVVSASSLVGSGAGSGGGTASLVSAASLSGGAGGAGSGSAELVAAASLSGAATGTGGASAELRAIASLEGAASGTGSGSADLRSVASMAASLSGAGSLSGELTTVASMVASLVGEGHLTAELGALASMAASLEGAGILDGELTTVVNLEAELIGTGSLSGLLETVLPELALGGSRAAVRRWPRSRASIADAAARAVLAAVPATRATIAHAPRTSVAFAGYAASRATMNFGSHTRAALVPSAESRAAING